MTPTRYAATVSAPRRWTHFSGEKGFQHDYADDKGNRGIVNIVPRDDNPEGQTLHVDWIGPRGVSPGEVGNTSGPANIRSIASQLFAHYPDAVFVSGLHTGGAHTGTTKRATVRIPGRQTASERAAGGRLPKRVLRREGAVIQNAKRQPNYPEVVHHAAAVIDNPLDNTAMMTLADHLSDLHGGDPAVDAFQRWTQGGPWEDVVPHIKPSLYRVTANPVDGTPYLELKPMPRSGVEQEVTPEMRQMPAFRRVHGQPLWQRRVYRTIEDEYPRRIGHFSTQPVRRVGATSAEVAHAVYTHGGPAALIQAVIGARHFHPDRQSAPGFNTRTVNFSRPGLPRRLAKIARPDDPKTWEAVKDFYPRCQ